jgi:hypothetical protein
LRAALIFAVFALACGPVTATSVIDDAEAAAVRAHSGEGEKYAAYDTALADLYLQKAREEQGHAHYSDAEDLAQEALTHAKEATRKAAEKRTSAAATPQTPQATVQRPAAPVTPAPAQPVTPGKPDKKAPIPVDDLTPPPSKDKK